MTLGRVSRSRVTRENTSSTVVEETMTSDANPWKEKPYHLVVRYGLPGGGVHYESEHATYGEALEAMKQFSHNPNAISLAVTQVLSIGEIRREIYITPLPHDRWSLLARMGQNDKNTP